METIPQRFIATDEARGIYGPQHFVKEFRPYITDAREEDLEVVESGPDSEWYWEAWMNIETSATVILPDYGDLSYRIEQDGDIWLIPEE